MPIRNFQEDLAAARRGEPIQHDHLDDAHNGNGRHYGAVSSSSVADEVRQQRELREVDEDHGPVYRVPAHE